jgi:hypothetical protein
LLAWYEGWARKEHAVRARADADGDAAGRAQASSASSSSSSSSSAGASAGGGGGGAGGGGASPFDPDPPVIPAEVHLPDAVTDPETRAYLQGFGEEWLRRFKAAAKKGGIIGIPA